MCDGPDTNGDVEPISFSTKMIEISKIVIDALALWFQEIFDVDAFLQL